MTILNLLVIAIILAVAVWIWYNYAVPNLPPPLVFLRWFVPLLVAVAIILWLLSLVFGGSILNTKILFIFLPPLLRSE